ncbi:MAG: glycosyltransferase family 2 protein [Pirellulaceae bacterium]
MIHSSTEFRPLVSLVIPIYNGSKFMREAIESALAQTYPHLEIIVVNDGSNDDGRTEEIALSYGDKIRYFAKSNGGCASALNLAISKMSGEYFSWLSHDDRYLPDKIAHQVATVVAGSDPDAIVYSGYQLIDEASRPLATVRPSDLLPEEQLTIPLLPLLRGLIHGCTLLIPKKYFVEVGTFDESLPTTQDYDLWFRILRVAPLVYDDSILVESRVHPDQDTHRHGRKHIDECNQLWSGFLNRLTDQEMTRMEGSPYAFLRKTAAFLAATPYDVAHQRAEELARERLRDTKISVILPFHNRFEWLWEAVQSVQAQTHANWELVMVDDGSTSEPSQMREIIGSDSRIRYIRQEQRGPAGARNAGVQSASGSYIAFLDSDDRFLPQKLERQLQFMEDNGHELSHTSYTRIDADGKELMEVSSGKLNGRLFPAIIACCPIAMPTVMGRAEIFRRHAFIDANEVGEDVCLWILLAMQHAWGSMDEPLSHVRIGPQTAAFHPRKQVIGLLNVATFCMRHDSLMVYQLQIKSLLRAAVSLLTDADGPEEPSALPARSTTPAPNGWMGGTLQVVREFPRKARKELGRFARRFR